MEAKSGLVLRSAPTTNSQKILVIPYHARLDDVNDYYFTNSVKFLSNSGMTITNYEIVFLTNQEVIDGIAGRWVIVKYGNTNGWAFNGYISKLSVMISRTKTNENSYFYEFIIPQDSFLLGYYETLEEIDKEKYMKSVFKDKQSKFYLVEEKNTTVIENFDIELLCGMFYYPAITFTSKKKFDENYALLLKEDAYIDYKNRHKKHINNYKTKLTSPVKLKGIKYKKIHEQWLVDVNGDGEKEIISYIQKTVPTCLGNNQDINAIVVTFKNNFNVFLTGESATYILQSIQLVPFHDYPVIKFYQASLCSGNNGVFMVIFEKNSNKPIYYCVDSTDSV